MGTTQQTVTFGETDKERERPKTLLYCPECDDFILRSRRFDHEHSDELWTEEDWKEAQREKEREELEDKVPPLTLTETQTYRVEFITEHREVVTVEARHESNAKELAEMERDYKGEFTDTLHTDVSSWGSPSQASIEYLENNGILPSDHDVTEEDIERLRELNDMD